MKKLVKQDIGFLEYPLWFQDCQRAGEKEEGFLWKDLEGFVFRAGYKPPVKLDLLFLLYLLFKSQDDGWKKEIELSRFEILKACGIATGKREYERLEDSLKRWKMVGIEFQGTFYDGKKYAFMNFGVIDDWEIEEESKKLRVTLSSRWVEKIQHSTYFKMLDFEQIKSLRTPLATRLYELLVKTFQTRNLWSCGAKKLAAKIPMNEKYPSDIIPKIKAAVNRINEKTELQIKLTIRRPARGKAIFEFEKLSPAKGTLGEGEEGTAEAEILDVGEEQREGLGALLALLPVKHRPQKTLREAVSRTLRKKGSEYVRRNILYANERAKDNYRVFLIKGLREDWGAGYIEDQEETQKKKRLQEAEEAKKREEAQKEAQLEKAVHQAFSVMSEEERLQLEEEAKAALTPEMLKSSLASTLIQMQVRAILTRRLEA